jgi:type IX secretion system PorP/SprF family membrane protein
MNRQLVGNLFCVFWLTLTSFSGLSQNQTQSRLFSFNPHLLNTAYLGAENKPNVVLFYRQQWLGINDGPANYGFNFQYPTKKKVSFGFNYNASETVLLRTDGMLASLAYKVSIGKDHMVRFGISGGASFFRLDLDNADYSNDPAVLSAASGRSYAIGNFGVLYKYKKIKIGFALPELFGKNHLTKSGKYTQFLNQLYSFSGDYKFKSWRDDFFITNYLLYRLSYDYQNNWEVGGVLSMRNLLRVGLSYRENSGLGFLIGVKALSMFGFGYSFESKTLSSESIGAYSHELHLDFNIQDIIKAGNKSNGSTTPNQ